MRRPGLRIRVIAVFAGGALLISAAMALLSYQLTRNSLLAERERTATRTTYFDATVVQSGLSDDGADVVGFLRALDTGALRKPVLRRDGQWYARDADSGVTASIPPSLRQLVEHGQPACNGSERDTGPALVLGIPLSRPPSSTRSTRCRNSTRPCACLRSSWASSPPAPPPAAPASGCTRPASCCGPSPP